uniref:Alternative protein AGAP3 n=1 Tax=Homo sapiens TaxID=9606 RepID=L8EB86_HUMAN|nr:alternative protein AGAP3 [Homo sapiens]
MPSPTASGRGPWVATPSQGLMPAERRRNAGYGPSMNRSSSWPHCQAQMCHWGSSCSGPWWKMTCGCW